MTGRKESQSATKSWVLNRQPMWRQSNWRCWAWAYNPRVEFRYYIDSATGEPHIYAHGVSETEVEDIFNCAYENRRGREDSRVAVGRTRGGRYLRVIYVPDARTGSIFVITAYELGRRGLWALRRRRRREKR